MNVKLFILGILMIVVVYNTSSAQCQSQSDSIIAPITELDEVVVNSILVKHDSRSDEYQMIPKLIQGSTSVYDVLSKLPGVTYNNISNSVSVRMDQKVLIEVNGNRVSPEYVQALPLDRISRIQVVYAPHARYTTEGYRYVINIKLKSDYMGHDLYVGNYTMISAGHNNGSNNIANEQPKAQYIYSGKKVDVTAGYGYATIHWNYPLSYSREYKGIASINTEEVNAKNPNDRNATNSHSANLGLDWQLSPYQTLSFRGIFQKDKTNHQVVYDAIKNDVLQGTTDRYFELSDEFSKVKDVAGALYYQGMFKNGWSLYSALGYDRMRDNLNSEYNGEDFKNAEEYRNAKDYFRGEFDLNYSFSDLLTLNLGYRGIFNRYMTHDRESDIKLLNNQEWHHNGYVFLDWNLRENILLHGGLKVEVIRKKGLEQRHNWLEFLPQITATWQPSDKVQVLAEYTSKMEYPSLYQVSASLSSIDKRLLQTGNAQLLPSRHQIVSLQGTFFESLIIGAEYTHTHNSITDWYDKLNDQTFFKTFTNVREQEFKAIGAYDWTIMNGLTWSNIIQWQWQQVSGNGLSNHVQNFSWHSDVDYWIEPIALQVKVEYLREMQKIPLLQGWQQYGQDLWQLSLSKNFLCKSLSITLNYVPPFHHGLRTKQKSCINTSVFNQMQEQNLKTYDNLLMLRIEWRFNKGRNKQRRVPQYEFESEQKKDKGLL